MAVLALAARHWLDLASSPTMPALYHRAKSIWQSQTTKQWELHRIQRAATVSIDQVQETKLLLEKTLSRANESRNYLSGLAGIRTPNLRFRKPMLYPVELLTLDLLFCRYRLL